jgi:hypothetical protein
MEEMKEERNTGKSVFSGQKNCIFRKVPGKRIPPRAEPIIG